MSTTAQATVAAATRAATPAPTPAASTDPAARLQQALARLDATRGALRLALITPPDPPAGAGSARALADPLRRLWRRLRRAARQTPAAVLLTDAVQGWWQRHPWRPAGSLLCRQVQPALRRHPLVAAALAAAAGATLAGLRPWRWPAVHRQLHPLPGRLLHWLLQQAGSAPVQAALASLLLMALRADPPAGKPPGPPAA